MESSGQSGLVNHNRMALNALGGDPCSKLNGTSYPELWLPSSASDSDAFPLISNSGNTANLLSSFTTTVQNKNLNLLASPESNSTFRLMKFMSGAGTAGTTSQLNGFMMKKGTAYQTIVDSYFTKVKSNYPISYGATGGLTDGELNTVLTNLLTDGRLVTESEMISQEQLNQADPNKVTPGTETLLYLSKISLTAPLSAAQQQRKETLETKNLSFYTAFLIEYCFYRTRYQWLLKKYFNVYATATDKYTYPNAGAPPFSLFSGQGQAPNQYSSLPLTQPDYLKGMAYHLAILNTRLTDMRRLLSAVNTYYTGVFTKIQTTINSSSLIGSNVDLENSLNALKASSNEAKQYLTEAQFKEGAMKYTMEKNKYTSILLALYAVLNIGALAMIYKLK